MLQKFNKKGASGPAPSPALPAPIPHGPVRQKCPEQPRRLAFRLLTQRVSQRHQPILAHAQSFSLMLNHSKPLRQRHDLSTAGFRIIRSLAGQLGGTVSFQNGTGATFSRSSNPYPKTPASPCPPRPARHSTSPPPRERRPPAGTASSDRAGRI